MKYSITIQLILLFFASLTPLFSMKHFVSPTGTSSWAQSTNIQFPCSTRTAFDNAEAGDTVLFLAGIYLVPRRNFGDSYNGYYYPKHSGTIGNPIVFMRNNKDSVIFNGTAGGSGDHTSAGTDCFATIFGTNNQSWIVFDGFTFQADEGTTQARVMIGTEYGEYSGATGCEVKNCTFNGGNVTGSTNIDNREGLRIEAADNTTVENCYFFNYRQSNNNHNTSAIKTYHDTVLTISNCEFSNNSVAIFIKSQSPFSTISNNFIHDNYQGILITPDLYPVMCMDSITIFNNLLFNNSGGDIIWSGAGTDMNTHGNYFVIANNTIYGISSRPINMGYVTPGGNGPQFYNNIVIATSAYSLVTQDMTGWRNYLKAVDHNQWGSSFKTIRIGDNRRNQNYTTLAAWKTSGQLEEPFNAGCGSSLNPGCGSLSSDPQFENSSGTLKTLIDFRLKPTSPCRGSGRDGIDIGANIDIIGTSYHALLSVVPPVIPGTILADSTQGERIKWAVNAKNTVLACSVSVSFDSAETWNTIQTVSGNTDSISWIVPDIVASHCFLKVTAVDDSGNTATGTSNRFNIIDTIAIKKKQLLRGSLNRAYTDTILAVAIEPIKWSLTNGSLPGGLTMDTNGIISGTPVATGTFPFTVRMTDAETHTALDTFSIIIDSLLAGQVKVLPPVLEGNGIVYADSVREIAVSASAFYNIALCSLYISLDSAKNWSPLTEMGGRPGNYSWKVPDTSALICFIKATVYDDSANTASATSLPFRIVNKLLSIEHHRLPDGLVGLEYSAALTANAGISPLAWSVTTDSLPPGLTLASATGSISGKPTTAGTFRFAATVVDAESHSARDTFSITIDTLMEGSIAVTPPVLSGKNIIYADTTPKKIYLSSVSSFPIAACSLFISLDSSKTWSLISSVEPYADSFSWKEVPDTAAKFCLLKFTAVDDSGNSASALSIVFEIINTTGIKNKTLLDGTQGRYYRDILLPETGIPPYTWGILSGRLPPGLLLDSLTGIIMGTPDSGGVYGFETRMTDAEKHTATARCTITVNVIIVGENVSNLHTTQVAVATGKSIKDTIVLQNDKLALNYTVYSGRADGPVQNVSYRNITLSNGTKALEVTIPANNLNDTVGQRAFIVIDNDTIFDTVSIAHPVLRQRNNFDNITVDSMVWTPLSVTATPENNDIASVLSAYKPSDGDWKFDKSKFRIFQWLPSPATVDNNDQWVEGTDSNRSIFRFVPGKLFWIVSAGKKNIDFGKATVAPVDPAHPVSITLYPDQCTDFSIPYAFPVSLQSVIDATRNRMLSNKERVDNLDFYRFEKEGNTFNYVLLRGHGLVTGDSLAGGPGNGYTVHNYENNSFNIAIPPGSPTPSGPIVAKRTSVTSAGSFHVRFNFHTVHGHGLNPVFIGYTPGNSHSVFLEEPPSFSKCRVSIKDSLTGNYFGHALVNDLSGGGILNEFVALNSSEKPETITIPPGSTTTLPDDYSIRLFDETRGSFLSAGDSLNITIPPRSTFAFLAAIGTEDFIAATQITLKSQAIGLISAYQIPGNSRIVVNYTLPQLAQNIKRIRFQLIDLKGRTALDHTQISGFNAGGNRLLLNMNDRHGSSLQSGVYILRVMMSGNRQQLFSRKITLMY